jgi:hypothetical protein
MPHRQPPWIPPGPLSRQTADALMASLRDLFQHWGGFTAMPPLFWQEDRQGMRVGINPSALGSYSTTYTTGTTTTYGTGSTIDVSAGILIFPTTIDVSPVQGAVYLNTTTGLLNIYNGTVWIALPAIGINGVFPQWFKYTITIVTGPKFRVTAPDGTTVDTVCAAATSQTITITSPAAGAVLTAFKRTIPAAFTGTGLATLNLNLGYSGGDGTASNVSAYVSTMALITTTTRPSVFGGGSPMTWSNAIDGCPNQASAWNLTAQFTANVNLTNLTAGEVDLWFLMGLVP